LSLTFIHSPLEPLTSTIIHPLLGEDRPPFYDTILYVRSRDSIYLDQDLLFGNPMPGRFEPPRIEGYTKVAIDEKELQLEKIQKYVRNRSVLLMIENEHIIPLYARPSRQIFGEEPLGDWKQLAAAVSKAIASAFGAVVFRFR